MNIRLQIIMLLLGQLLLTALMALASPKPAPAVFLASTLLLDAPKEPGTLVSSAERSAVPGLIQKGDWAEAQKIVDRLLAANPEDVEAQHWQSEIKPIDTWPAVYIHGKAGLVGEFWLRKKWVGFSDSSGNDQLNSSFQLPIESLEVKYKGHTAWVQPGYGEVSHGLDIKAGKESYRIVTRFPFYEVLSMHHRIRSMQIKSLLPEPPLPPGIETTLRGKDTGQVKTVLEESIKNGWWGDAETALRFLSKLAPDDPEVKRYQDEVNVVSKWSVRTWSPSDGYAGTLYLRKHYLTFEGEDYGSDRKKPLKNDSFHFPLSALKKVSTCSEKEYGAKSGTGGLLDLVPGWAADVATGKNWGFEFEFGPGQKYKLIIRGGEGESKDSVKEDIRDIKARAGLIN